MKALLIGEYREGKLLDASYELQAFAEALHVDCAMFIGKFEVTCCNGKLRRQVTPRTALSVLTIQAGAFSLPGEPQGTPQRERLELSGAVGRVQFAGYEAAEKKEVDLSRAEVIVSAGRGVGKKDNVGRERGQGSGYAEGALSEAAAYMAEPYRYGGAAPSALLGGGIPEYNLYRADEGWVAVAALEPHFKKRLEEALGIGTAKEYENAFATRSASAWQQWGQELDIPIVALVPGGVDVS